MKSPIPPSLHGQLMLAIVDLVDISLAVQSSPSISMHTGKADCTPEERVVISSPLAGMQ